jgi:small-conductance mechanosensitive channel
MKKSIVVLFVMGFLIPHYLFSQKDSLNLKNNDETGQLSDSLNSAILNEYNDKVKEIELIRLADSVKKAELEAQLKSLKTTDNIKKEELQKQLQELSNKDANRIAQKRTQIDSLRKSAKAFPVTGFFNDTLFLIYSRLGSFSAQDRAQIISKRIRKLNDNFLFTADSLKLVEAETTIDIVSGENIIMSISENDAIWNNSTKYDLAESTRKIIGTAVMNYKSQTSLSTILKKVALALLALLVLFFIIRYTVKLFRWTAHKITEQEEKQIKGIKIKNYTLFDAKMQIKLFLTINRIVEWVSILLIIYISLPILFGIFPWTKNFANILFGFILNPVKSIALSIWDYLPNLITIIVIIIVFRYVLKGLKFLKLEVEKGELSLPGFYPEWANPTYQLIRVLVYAFMIIVIFPYLPGSESPIFRGVSVFLGFLFTFGSAGSLSNIMSGLILTYMRLFKKGDRVKIGDVVGDIIEKSLLVTRVRTIKNEIISIPNSTIMNSHTINYSSDAAEKGLIIHTTVTIGYDVPWREMHQALIDAAIKTDLILDTPKPFVLQTSLDDFYVSYQINGYVRESNKQAVIYSNLHQNIQDICNERGIEILSPHYRAARDGNMTTIPASYLPDDYQKPSFDIKLEKENDK